MMRLPIVGALAILGLQAAACAAFADEFAAVRQTMRSYVEDEKVPSIAVAAVRGNTVVWLDACGWADRESRTPSTPKTAFMLSSTSKPITATSAMIAVEKSLLRLDGSINGYLDAAQFRSRLGDASQITVRDLLMHRSGIANHNETYFLDGDYRPPNIDGLIQAYGWTMLPRGEFHYSNLGYSALARAIERTGRRTFSQFVQQEVFDPLGMRDSYVPDPASRPRAGAAVRYDQEGNRVRDFSTGMVPAAEIYSSVLDLARFSMFHLHQPLEGARPILSDTNRDEMWKAASPIPFYHYGYGLGWSVGKDKVGRHHVFHGGGFTGTDSLLVLLPDEQVAVACLSNQNRRWPGVAVSQDIVEKTLAALLDDEPANVSLDYGRVPPAETDAKAARFLGRWEGTLTVDELEVAASLTIHDNGHAQAQLGNQAAVEIRDTEFIGNAFFGAMTCRIDTPTSRHPEQEQLTWDVRMNGDQLTGVLYVRCPTNGDGYLLPYWISLKRARP